MKPTWTGTGCIPRTPIPQQVGVEATSSRPRIYVTSYYHVVQSIVFIIKGTGGLLVPRLKRGKGLARAHETSETFRMSTSSGLCQAVPTGLHRTICVDTHC